MKGLFMKEHKSGHRSRTGQTDQKHLPLVAMAALELPAKLLN